MSENRKNIFVVGLDPFNLQELKQLRHASEYDFHALCDQSELQQAEGGSFNEILELCRRRLKEFNGSIDSIIAFWDFPAEAIVPILRKEYGMPYTTLESLEQCEHKYWSRVAQQKAVPEAVPDFRKVDPFDPQAVENFDMKYPFWLKPVNSFSSYLGFKINDEAEFREKLAVVREAIDDIAKPYDELLEKVSLPYNLHDVGGQYCVAEEIMSGEMFASCGYVWDGEVHIYGLVDVIRTENQSTLSRLQYPSRMAEGVQQRAIAVSKKLMAAIGYDNAAFHIEFFYDEATDRLRIVEINPRISQSHNELFRQVDGEGDMEIPIELGLGKAPQFPHRKGTFNIAAKYYLRHDENAYVRYAPTAEDIARLNETYPEVRVKILVESGGRLDDVRVQDSYSFELADIYLGAENEAALLKKLASCIDMLPFDLEPVRERKTG